jgi:hypothetical protein
MPLTDEQKAALATLKGADPVDFADALRADAQPLYQRVFKSGFDEAEGRWKARAKEAEGKLAEAETARTEAEQRLADAQSKVPDVAKINDEWTQKIAKLKADADAALVTERTARQQERQARTASDLKAALSGLDPDYIEVVATKHAQRLRYRDDGSLELLEDGGQTPVALAGGKTPVAHLAEEIRQKADAKWVLSNADRGGGVRGGEGGGGGGDVFARIRNEVKQQQEAQVTDSKPLAARLGQVA